GDTLALLTGRTAAFEVVVPAVPRLAGAVRDAVATWPVPVRIVTDPADKDAAFRTARAALTKSGTSTLELALAGVPMVAAYLVSLPEAVVGQLLIKAHSAILANLVLGENVVPEFLQWHCSPEKLAAALLPLLSDTPERQRQLAAFAGLDRIMDIGGPAPSERAATLILHDLQRT
ncbi:MAG: lipid-A-disaccharide synthase, partial [Pseudolabrys sp.]|nr:lipid-A-disaccharide synthase [Pseudolabrys sp.]